ncbi:WbqC family protein [Aliiroseovarius marinus]|uniref:WbqC family protein n=1 Tax=Aliiroseovarius marinus TaxID=2500159 RepID=UPI003D7CE166
MTKPRTLAVMQPYLFPAANYFQLVNVADDFVFYDDVDYINRGWINRNRIQQAGKEVKFSVPVSRGPRGTPIKDVPLNEYPMWRSKFLKTLSACYASAPSFEAVFELVTSVLDCECETISELAIESITATARYLELDARFYRSSVSAPETRGIGRTERMLALCERFEASRYVNSIGGQELYDVDDFAQNGIELKFLEPVFPVYEQPGPEFLPMLSMIDVMMYMSREDVRTALGDYSLVS